MLLILDSFLALTITIITTTIRRLYVQDSLVRLTASYSLCDGWPAPHGNFFPRGGWLQQGCLHLPLVWHPPSTFHLATSNSLTAILAYSQSTSEVVFPWPSLSYLPSTNVFSTCSSCVKAVLHSMLCPLCEALNLTHVRSGRTHIRFFFFRASCELVLVCLPNALHPIPVLLMCFWWAGFALIVCSRHA